MTETVRLLKERGLGSDASEPQAGQWWEGWASEGADVRLTDSLLRPEIWREVWSIIVESKKKSMV